MNLTDELNDLTLTIRGLRSPDEARRRRGAIVRRFGRLRTTVRAGAGRHRSDVGAALDWMRQSVRSAPFDEPTRAELQRLVGELGR